MSDTAKFWLIVLLLGVTVWGAWGMISSGNPGSGSCVSGCCVSTCGNGPGITDDHPVDKAP